MKIISWPICVKNWTIKKIETINSSSSSFIYTDKLGSSQLQARVAYTATYATRMMPTQMIMKVTIFVSICRERAEFDRISYLI